MSDDLTVNGLVKWETFQKVVTERDRLRQALRELPVEGNAAMLFAQNAALRGENASLSAERDRLLTGRAAFDSGVVARAQEFVEEQTIRRLRAERRLSARRKLCRETRDERDQYLSWVIGLSVLLDQDLPGWDVATELGQQLAMGMDWRQGEEGCDADTTK